MDTGYIKGGGGYGVMGPTQIVTPPKKPMENIYLWFSVPVFPQPRVMSFSFTFFLPKQFSFQIIHYAPPLTKQNNDMVDLHPYLLLNWAVANLYCTGVCFGAEIHFFHIN